MSNDESIPRVSLGLPVYNGQNYLAEAIESLLAQDFSDFELLIVDNASIDATAQISAAFVERDARVRYFRNERNVGAAANFNRAFLHSRAPYFKWCAHDDLHSANYVSEMVEILDRDPDCVIAYPRVDMIDEFGRPTGRVWLTLGDMRDMSPASRFGLMIASQGWDGVLFGLWRRSAMERTLLQASYYGSDCALLAEMSLLGSFVPAATAKLFNRDHPERAMNLHYSERGTWQDTRKQSRRALEISNRIVNLMQIAWRHRAVAPFYRTLPSLLGWALRPHQSGRVLLEAVGFVSPTARSVLRSAVGRVIQPRRTATPSQR